MLVFHTKGELQRPPSGAGRPPLGRPAWGCSGSATTFSWVLLIRSWCRWCGHLPETCGKKSGSLMEAKRPASGVYRPSISPTLHIDVWNYSRHGDHRWFVEHLPSCGFFYPCDKLIHPSTRCSSNLWMTSPTTTSHFESPLEVHMRPFGLSFTFGLSPKCLGFIGESPSQWYWVVSDLREVSDRQPCLGWPAYVKPTGLTGQCRWSSRRRNFFIQTPNQVIQVSILIISTISSTWRC